MGPDYTTLGRRLAERAEPLQPPEIDAQHNYAFGNLAEAMMRMYQDLASIVDPDIEDLSPWQVLFDVDLCPYWALPWLAQCVGVRLPVGLEDAEARQAIKELSFEKVGTPTYVENMIKLYLDDPKTVYFRERDTGDAYRLEIVTVNDQTPDPALIQQIIDSGHVIPAGIIVNYRTVDGWDYQQMTVEGGPYSALPARFDNYGNMSLNDRS